MKIAEHRGDEPMKGVAAAIVTAILIGALYFGREVFVPVLLNGPAAPAYTA